MLIILFSMVTNLQIYFFMNRTNQREFSPACLKKHESLNIFMLLSQFLAAIIVKYYRTTLVFAKLIFYMGYFADNQQRHRIVLKHGLRPFKLVFFA